MAIMLSATNGQDELFMEVLDSYIFGKITLEEMETRIDRFEYLGAKMQLESSIKLRKQIMKRLERSIR